MRKFGVKLQMDAPVVKKSAALLKAMANKVRLAVLRVLAESGEEFHVTRLLGMFTMSQSSLSQHLAQLREAKLVTTRRDAQTVYYSLSSNAVRVMLRALDQVCSDIGDADATDE